MQSWLVLLSSVDSHCLPFMISRLLALVKLLLCCGSQMIHGCFSDAGGRCALFYLAEARLLR